MTSARTLAVIGGSGLYDMPGLQARDEHAISTPFGHPSDVILSGRVENTTLLFLARHGRGHRIPPHRVNYRANIYALKELGAEQVVSVSAVGSMRESIHPGDIVLVDQFIDRTRSRPNTFFDEPGLVAHVEFADPVDPALQEALYRSSLEVGAKVHRGGTYVCIEGPQFSTRAESNLFRSWGVHVIGMTNLPEARLAREAELPYATLALATDYDCWHQAEGDVQVEAVLAVIRQNADTARNIIRHVATRLPDPEQSPARQALAHALLTAPDQIPEETRKRLALLVDRHLN